MFALVFLVIVILVIFCPGFGKKFAEKVGVIMCAMYNFWSFLSLKFDMQLVWWIR